MLNKNRFPYVKQSEISITYMYKSQSQLRPIIRNNEGENANRFLSKLINALPACGKYFRPLLIYVNTLGPDYGQQNVQAHLRSKLCDTRIKLLV